MRLIDADALYERACELEAQALEYVGKIIHDDEKIEEWRKWSSILNEQTAFKHDVYDAPTIELERKIGHWIDTDNYYQRWKCSECGCHTRDAEPNYCPHCGTKMGEKS